MALCSIHIPGFIDLVAGIEQVRLDLAGDRSAVSGRLQHVLLPTGSLMPVDTVLGWADGEIMGLHRRLAMALQIEASTPGQQLYAQFDENDLSTKSRAQVEADARRVADFVNEGGGEIPQEILDLLREGRNDPYFAQALAGQVDLEQLAGTLRNAAIRPDLAHSTDPAAEHARWQTDYEELLDGLGQTLGLASRGTGDVAPPHGWDQRWIEAITAMDNPGQASNLAAVVSRGTWSTDFTVGLVQAIYDLETGDRGMRGMWQMDAYPMGTYLGATLPDGTQAYDPLALVLQAAARNPEAGMRIFQESGTTTVTAEGEDRSVSAFMDYLISQRRWPVDDGQAAGEMILGAATPYEGGSVYSAQVADDAYWASEAFKEEVASRRDDAPWWSSAGHIVLDVLGMVPGIGELADGVNAVWYFAEGNVIDGSLSMVALVPLGGQAATAGKWGRRVLTADEAAAVLRNLDNVPLNQLDDSVQLLARGDNIGPGVFRFDSMADFNAAANRAHPNVRYEYNDMFWRTDEAGRTAEVGGQLSLNPGGRDARLQGEIGRGPDALDSDVGFHLIADSLGGPTNRLNVLPGNGRPIDDGLANLNQGAYARMENVLRGALQGGSEVRFNLRTVYPEGITTRPDRFVVEAWIDGRPRQWVFDNK
ncbi:DNA/RNA non-specific endonuclease [Ornithinimicrobium sufpigmenti]|uniref:DNA/RNA non-specific endonuclease n=1 Tax=Ornithinimicrobium sufpigmenti TaxID=2508882 RepID=UPI001035F208|nr:MULTISPECIES: DNA/RNA non-specific endonuclease [unclassified Ornithinimicrobium]